MPAHCRRIAESTRLSPIERWGGVFNRVVKVLVDNSNLTNKVRDCSNRNPITCMVSDENPANPFSQQGILATAGDRSLAKRFDRVLGKGIWRRFS